ncbi:unnamed protein product [Rotaria magnacalcarata]|uniref:Uncharacterized protein n=1 Tax=Rotaria magnacalcarata TaxID=392030 RepID=A0A8S2WLU0_9BILA|nr:unnamed protein product [Rotaria magnacalcarata]CAF4449993.1 unnamed protein product [Rotaria magnacalcarata]
MNGNQSLSLKRHRTNGSEYQCDDNINLVDNDNENSYQQQKSSKYKRRNNQPLTTNSRTYTNSNSNITDNRNFQQGKSQTNDINDSKNKHYDNRENPFHISYQALTYAAATHLQRIKLEYEGNIQGTTKVTDLYVFLCNPHRYPKEIDNIKISPHPSKHLPPQRSVILKWIKNSISCNELKEELEIKFKSIHSIVDIIGTLNTRNRHLRIDFQDETEYNTILNSGKVSIYGQLIDCDERCGKDRNDKEDHNLCEIRCHHCDGPHTSTDYSCLFIQEYRRELVLELRNHPDLLLAEAKLFIPTECRESGKGTKILGNKSAQYQQFKKNQNQWYHPFNHLSSDYKNQWPSSPHSSSDSHTSISNNN